MTELRNIVLLGCGKMGGALAENWTNTFSDLHLTIIDPNPVPLTLQQKPNATYAPRPEDAGEQLRESDCVFLAVKPQIFAEACSTIKDYVNKNSIIVSIAAGITIEKIETLFGKEQPVMRAMPNTPAQIGEGATGVCVNSLVTTRQRENAALLLQCCGPVYTLDDEQDMHALTALSGSGPAYIFYLTECMEAAGKELGLNDQLAKDLARQTIIGSAALLKAQDKISASKLRQDVTSPGGTTEAALEILMDGDWKNKFTQALQCAKKRSEELGRLRVP